MSPSVDSIWPSMSKPLLATCKLLVFGVLLCLIPSAAAGPVRADLTASSVEWAAVEPMAIGEVLAFQSRLSIPGGLGPQAGPVEPIDDSLFQIQGAYIEVQMETADFYADTPVLFSALPPSYTETPFVHHATATYTMASVSGTMSRPARSLYVFPMEGSSLRAVSDCAQVLTASDNEVRATSRIANRADLVEEVVDALQVAPCAGSDVTLVGNFIAVCWEWDAHLTANEGEAVLWSGKADSQGASDPTGATGASTTVSKAQQVYYVVYDGTFTIRGNDPRPPRLFMDAVQLDQAAALTLTDANGQLDDQGALVDLTGRQVELRGAMETSLKRNGNTVDVQVQGIQSLAVDGEPVALAATVAAPTQTSSILPWVLGFGAVGLVAIPTFIVPKVHAARRHRIESLLYRCDRLFEGFDFAEMRRVALKALHLAPQEPATHGQVARALEQLGDFDSAQRHREGADALWLSRGDASGRAENALQAAYAMAARSEAVALRWIRVALQANPSVREEMIHEPRLELLLRRLEVPAETPYWLRP